MSEPITVPALDELGRDLHQAWRRHEVRSRRRKQLVVLATLTMLLAVPGAIAERTVVGVAPDDHAPVVERGAGVVLSGDSAIGRWRLLSSRTGAMPCVNLALPGSGDLAYGGGCASSAGPPLTAGLRSERGSTFAFGLTGAGAARVRIRMPGSKTYLVDTRPPDPRTVSARYASPHLRYFVLVLRRSVPQAAGIAVEALDPSGRVIARAGRGA